jgi:hypothetical protein
MVSKATTIHIDGFPKSAGSFMKKSVKNGEPRAACGDLFISVLAASENFVTMRTVPECFDYLTTGLAFSSPGTPV